MSPANGISSSDPQPQYDYIVEQLSTLGIVYLHVVESANGGGAAGYTDYPTLAEAK